MRNIGNAVDAYLAELAAMGVEPSTLKNRRSLLTRFAEHVGPRLDSRRIDTTHVVSFVNAQAWSPSTRYERIGQMRTFFKWCRGRRYFLLDQDPMFGWRRMTPPDVDHLRLPFDEWATLFDACRTVRERTVLATGLFLFLRASEQKLLQVKHVDLQRDEISVYRQKSKRWDVMPIATELRPFITEQLEHTASLFAISPEHFLIPAGTPPSGRTPDGRLIAGTSRIDPTKPIGHPHRVVQSVLRRCGYETKGTGEHTLRRSGARAYFDELTTLGYDGALRRVQVMLGHKSSKTTEVYLGLDVDRHARNRDLRGQPMFRRDPAAGFANVIPIRAEK